MGTAVVFVLACLAVGVLLTLVLRLFLSRAAIPKGFRRIQRAALENIVEESAEGGWSKEQESAVRQRQYCRTEQNIGLFYTISRAKDHYVHRVTAQLKEPGGSEERVADLCLLLVADLTRQLRILPDQSRPRVRRARSQLGTHHLAFELTEEQQEQFRASLLANDGGR